MFEISQLIYFAFDVLHGDEGDSTIVLDMRKNYDPWSDEVLVLTKSGPLWLPEDFFSRSEK